MIGDRLVRGTPTKNNNNTESKLPSVALSFILCFKIFCFVYCVFLQIIFNINKEMGVWTGLGYDHAELRQFGPQRQMKIHRESSFPGEDSFGDQLAFLIGHF